MRRRGRFLRVATKLARALGAEECALAGGLAVMAHGFVRGTRDVDLVTRLPVPEAQRRLASAGLRTRLIKGDPLAGEFACLRGECEGLPFDVLPEVVPIHWDAAVSVETQGGTSLRVVALADLLALKLKAHGAKDLMDAAILVLMHPETRARARELATAYGVLDRLDQWLSDPRARAQAREEARYAVKTRGRQPRVRRSRARRRR